MASTRVISVFSPKGGSGKTILAVNLAVALSQEHQKVLLLDFDLKAPLDVAKTINVNPRFSLYDFSGLKDKASEELTAVLRDNVIKYSENLDYFPVVTQIQQIAHITVKLIRQSLLAFKSGYDYVVIDAGGDFTDVTTETLGESNLILLVANPDILSVYKTEWAIAALQGLHFPLAMIKLILNRAESKGGFSWQEMRVVIPCPIIAMIPSDGKAATLALNRQIPALVDDPQSKFSQGLKKLAKDLVDNKDYYVGHQEIIRDGASFLADRSIWRRSDMASSAPAAELDHEDEVVVLKQKIHRRLIEELHMEHVAQDATRMDADKFRQLREKVEQAITNLLAEETGKFFAALETRKRLVGEIVDEVLGLGPLEDLVKDPTITEIMVNNKDNIYIEKAGRIELTTKKFISNDQIRTTIERIIAPLGRRIDESTPMVDARLADGSRVNAIIPPLALTGPTLTIRKFTKRRLNVDELVKDYSSLTTDMARFLEACVRIRRNILVSGGTDSGKTTFLNILSECIPDTERVITIEDAAELRLHHRHWIRLESRPPNIEGRGEVTIRELFRNTLRMRPDRIIVGEVRGKEVLDMLQAMNTGHDGSMSTVHANSTQDVMMRLDSMILMSGVELPLRAIREMISSALNMIVHTMRLADGSRKIVQISEVCGMLDDRVSLKDIFVFKQTGVDAAGNALGEFKATGYIPTFFDVIKVRGMQLSEDVFKVR